MMFEIGEAFSRDEARAALRTQLQDPGAKTAFCRKHRLNRTVLSNFLAGRRPPGPKLLRAMKLKPMMIYVRRGK